LSKSCQKLFKKLSKSCQKGVKSCQKVVKKWSKKLSKSCQKVVKSCQKVVKVVKKWYKFRTSGEEEDWWLQDQVATSSHLVKSKIRQIPQLLYNFSRFQGFWEFPNHKFQFPICYRISLDLGNFPDLAPLVTEKSHFFHTNRNRRSGRVAVI
jgi:hypothetical protein